MNDPKRYKTGEGAKPNRLKHLSTKWLLDYRFSILGFLAAFLLFWVTVWLDLDLFEKFVYFLESRESEEIDELFFPILLFLIFLTINIVTSIRRKSLKNERIEVYKTMMQASNHVLKTCLNQMMLVKLTAEETPDFDPEVLKLFDKIVNAANAQLDALGKLEDVNVEKIWESLYEHGIHFDPTIQGKEGSLRH